MTIKYNFDEVVDRRNTYSIKWDIQHYLKRTGLKGRVDDDTIPIFTADMDFRCPPSVKDEIQKVVDFNLYGYTALEPEAGGPYYESVCRWFKERHNLEIHPEEIVFIEGTMTAVRDGIIAFSKPGDGVLICEPVYTPFMNEIVENGRVIVNSELVNTEGYYTVDFDDFERKAALPTTTCCLICNPHNPVGRVWTKEELLKMYDICTANNVVVIEDCVHSELIRCDQKWTPLLSITDGQNLVECTAVNKTFNLAALKASSIFIRNESMREAFKNVEKMVLVSPISVAAVVGAYNGGAEWLDQLKVYLDGTFDWCIDFIHENLPKVVCRRPEGTYALWMDFRGYGLEPDDQYKRIYYDANVLLSGGGAKFDPEGGQGFERMCIGTRRALVQEALKRIAKQFEDLN